MATDGRSDRGAVFLLVYYEITNKALRPQPGSPTTSRFWTTRVAASERRAAAASHTAMSGGRKDYLLVELQPGVTRRGVQVFEVPEEVLSSATLQVPEKGLFGFQQILVDLSRRRS